MCSNVFTTPLEGQYLSKIEGVIRVKYRDNIKFNVCKITYELHDDNNYQYIFEPYYDVLDALPSSMSQGIPGINLEKRKKAYYRVNCIPSFISERTMDLDRENIAEELKKVGMTTYNPLEWLIRTDTEYSGDNLIVERYRVPRKIGRINYSDLMYGDVIDTLDELKKDAHSHISELLWLIGNGVIFEDRGLQINEINRVGALQLLINQYEFTHIKEIQEKEVLKTKKKADIDDFVMEEIIKELELNIIDEKEEMRTINIRTRETLLRKIREYKKKAK